MQQLSEMDSTFLQQESVRTPMHIASVAIYDQSGRKEGKVRFKEILTVYERNLHKSSVFRRKVAGGAMGLDAPYWVEDPDFDLEFHIRHIALPKPGDWRQFCILLARLHARGLDMKRPLWEAYVIEGLSGIEGLPANSFAIMVKVHHSAIDGVSGAEILAATHSLTDEVAPPEVIDTWKGESDPSALQVWSRASLRNLQRPVKFVGKVRNLVPALIRANKLNQDKASHASSLPTKKTRFNQQVSSARVTDALIMELSDIKRIRQAAEGTTVNDVIVAIVGGGLRKYLISKDELPEFSLACGAPISMREERNSDSHGNQVSQMTISMCTDIEDPMERLLAVQQSAGEAKAYSAALGTSVLMDVAEIMTPRVLNWGMRAASFAAANADLPMPSHTVISNIPGPQMPIYLAGARAHMLMGMGPLMDLLGLFHAVLSCAGRITINFVSCREIMPDPEFYKACLHESYEELLGAADRSQAKVNTGAKGKSRKRKQGSRKKSVTDR